MGGQRSINKGPWVCASLLKKVSKVLSSDTDPSQAKPIKTWSRRSTILPDFIGLVFLVHNGRTFVPVKVSSDMIGFRLGEFAMTRLFRMHAGDRKSK